MKRISVVLVTITAALMAACGGDGPATYTFRGEEHEIRCDDNDVFVDQWVRYDGAESVFNEWLDECGEGWVEPAFDAILTADLG